MPPPIPVHLLPHDPAWRVRAEVEAGRLRTQLGPGLLTVHHVGSTAVPGLVAKPILDLLPVFDSEAAMEAARTGLEVLGYRWWGELGLAGRRYCTLDDPESGMRCIQLHCYVEGAADITRHVAFRDYLRASPVVMQAYAEEKRRCQMLHPLDSHAYGDCKGGWVQRTEAEALRWWASEARQRDKDSELRKRLTMMPICE